MRKALVLLLPVLALLAVGQAPAAAQVISVTPMSHDFGDMKQQETRTTKVTVSNNGAGLLTIEDVRADCGCTVPTLEKNSLAPGESTEIEIQFNSKKFNGHVIKTVSISSNDPLNPVMDVMVKANVHTPLIIDPVSQRLGFSRSLRGEVLTKEVVFKATELSPLEIAVDGTRKDLFQVAIHNGYEGDPQKAMLEVSVPVDAEPGRLRDHVRVTTNVPEMPSVDIEMQAWVAQAITRSPEQLSFRYKKNFHQYLRIAPFKEGVEFKVTKAEIDLPEINVEVIEVTPNKETKVLVEGAPIDSKDPRAIAAEGRMQGTLIIHTDLPEAATIEVPVSYMIRM